jgi:HSP20 family protein
MSTNEIDTTKSSESLSKTSLGSLLSFDEFDNFFDNFLARRWPRLDWNISTLSETGVPRVDILDHENDIEVQAALPGVKKEDLEVTINHQSITIRTCTKEEKEEEAKGNYFRREIIRGEFQRTLTLPDMVNSDKANASFNDGILKVIIPKAEQSKSKTLEIN